MVGQTRRDTIYEMPYFVTIPYFTYEMDECFRHVDAQLGGCFNESTSELFCDLFALCK